MQLPSDCTWGFSPLAPGTSRRLSRLIESLRFVIQVKIPVHDLGRLVKVPFWVTELCLKKDVRSGLGTLCLQLCLVEWGEKPPFCEMALWGQFCLICPLMNVYLELMWFYCSTVLFVSCII